MVIRIEQLEAIPLPSDLNVSGQAQGSVLYFNGTNWVTLNPGTDGYVLTTHSTGANPTWTLVSGGGGAGLTNSAPLNTDNTAASVGVSTLAARGDHHHQINAGIPVAIGATNSQGSATTLALSDHLHQVQDLHIASQVQGSTLFFNGSNWVQLSPAQDGYFLTTHNSGANPTWTKQSTVGTDLNLSGQAQGDIAYFNGTNWTRLGASFDGYVLATHNVGNNPSWIQTTPKIITEATAARTLSASDMGNYIRFTDGYAIAVTVPTNANVPVAQGVSVLLRQAGAGQFTLVPQTVGVTLNTTTSLISAKQGASVTLTNISPDNWDVTGLVQ